MEWISTAQSSPLVQTSLLLIAAISALLLWRWSGQRGAAAAHWPPGPPAWPIIGHLHLLGHLPHQSLAKLAQTYGPLMGLRLGGVQTIVASSPQMAKEILQTHDVAMAYRPRTAAVVHMYFDGKDMGFAPYGPFWRRMRQLCATELFSAKRLASSRHVREEEAHDLARMVAEMGKRGQKEVELRASLLAASNNITCRMAMGKKLADVSGGHGGKHSLLSLTEELLLLLAVFYVGDFIPWLWWLDPHRYLPRMKATGLEAKALMQELIDQRRQKPQRASPQDLLDVLLAAAADPKQEIPITDDNIMGLILDLFAGGSDTSSVTVEWALANLINNPQAMHKLQEELKSVVGEERFVTEDDIDNLPYLGSVLKESMRLHPTVPLLLPHECRQECQIGGYKVPSKTRVYVNTWAIGRDPTVWERSLDFWPERFDKNKLDLRGQNFELLPFGAGRRGCPGWALGLLNVHLMVATLVQSFTWSLKSPSCSPNCPSNMTQRLDMSERFGLTVTMDKPLCAFATPRLSFPLFGLL
ncbi:hypothetical protein L7F22_066031 [Adiantum nelumboides]|nr:hypothetical protein [Adiantum nelumboides]